MVGEMQKWSLGREATDIRSFSCSGRQWPDASSPCHLPFLPRPGRAWKEDIQKSEYQIAYSHESKRKQILEKRLLRRKGKSLLFYFLVLHPLCVSFWTQSRTSSSLTPWNCSLHYSIPDILHSMAMPGNLPAVYLPDQNSCLQVKNPLGGFSLLFPSLDFLFDSHILEIAVAAICCHTSILEICPHPWFMVKGSFR